MAAASSRVLLYHKHAINIIKNHNKDSKKVAQVIAFVKESGGLDYAIKKMEEYHQKALNILEDFPESDVKDALKRMIDFVIRREQ